MPAAVCGRIPLAVGLNWRQWRCVSSHLPFWVDACGVCVCFLDAVLRCVHCAMVCLLWGAASSSCAHRQRRDDLCVCVCVLSRIVVRLAVVLLLCCVLTRGRNETDVSVGISPFFLLKSVAAEDLDKVLCAPLFCLVIAAACSSHAPHRPLLLPRCVGGVDERRLWWSGAPVWGGRHQPLLNATVSAAGNLARWCRCCHDQLRWTRTALRLFPLSSSLQFSADTRTARQRRDHHPDGCEPIGLCN
ncbi:trans-sialidase [Trypanosoma cruzi cruzi]|nr:trans-sialidase [Trypanosoma cruzi cruzi]